MSWQIISSCYKVYRCALSPFEKKLSRSNSMSRCLFFDFFFVILFLYPACVPIYIHTFIVYYINEWNWFFFFLFLSLSGCFFDLLDLERSERRDFSGVNTFANKKIRTLSARDANFCIWLSFLLFFFFKGVARSCRNLISYINFFNYVRSLVPPESRETTWFCSLVFNSSFFYALPLFLSTPLAY